MRSTYWDAGVSSLRTDSHRGRSNGALGKGEREPQGERKAREEGKIGGHEDLAVSQKLGRRLKKDSKKKGSQGAWCQI